MKFSELEVGVKFKSATGTGTKIGNRSAKWLTGDKAGQETVTSGSLVVLPADSGEDVTVKHNYKYKDETASKRMQNKRAMAKAKLLELGFSSAESLVTAIVNNEVKVVRIK